MARMGGNKECVGCVQKYDEETFCKTSTWKAQKEMEK
jgi:hypothetical protein